MIPSEFIEDLLHKVDIVEVIGRYVKLKKTGQNYVACCPFHKEKTPSFTVSYSKQFYHCFGCGASGTAITFLMKYSGLSFVESIELLSNEVGLVVPNSYVNHNFDEVHQLKEKRQNLEQIMQRISSFYCNELKNNSDAQEYLFQKRDLNNSICEKFLIGYAGSSRQELSKIFKTYNEDLINSGMVKKISDNNFYDHFRSRIMFPIRSLQGKIIGFGGRALYDDVQPKYLNSPETKLFDKSKVLYGLYENREGIRNSGKIIVVEGYMDVISLFRHGINYSVATLGTATTDYHIKILCRQSDNIYFCFDGDKAGKQAAWRALESFLPFLSEDKSVYFLFLEEGHDPDSYIRKNNKKKFENLLNNNSIILSEYLLTFLSENLNLDFDEDKSKLIKSFSNLVVKIKNINLRFFLIRNLSNKIKIDFEILNNLVINNINNDNKLVSNKKNIGNKDKLGFSKISTSVEKLILWLLINPKLAKYINIPEFINLDEELSALVALSESIKSLKNCTTGQIMENIRDSNFYNLINRIFINSKDIINEFNVIDDNDEKAFLSGLQKINNRINLLQLDELKYLMKFRDLTSDENKLLLYLSKRNF